MPNISPATGGLSLATLTKKINYCVELLQQGEADRAASHLRRTLDRYPANADVLHLLSVAVYQMGHPALAADYAEQAIAKSAGQPDYHSNLGRYYLSLGRAEDAERHLRLALTLAPGHGVALQNLAAALASLNRRIDAIEVARDYIRAAPDDAGGHHLAAFKRLKL